MNTQILRSIFFLVLIHFVSSLYSEGDDVVILTESNFDSSVIQSNDKWMVEFYAPWCGHCQRLQPTYKEAATKAKNLGFRLGAVDCTQERSLCERYSIRGYPTLKIFAQNKNQPSEFRGPRTVDAILSAIQEA